MIRLVKPSLRFKRTYLAAVREGAHEKQITRVKDPGNDFHAFLRRFRDLERGKKLPKGYVPSTHYWLMDTTSFIGWVDIRHRLTPRLRLLGGHIGYWIRPSKRQQGYGTVILRLAIRKAKRLGIKNVLVTCDPKNIASRKIIESNGGAYKDTISVPFNSGKPEARFSIKVQ